MSNEYQFPFGEYLHPVVQEDRTPKKVFVLGMLSGSSECKYIEKEYIIRNLEKAKIDYAYKEINLNKIKEISDCIMEIFVYCNENTLYYDISNFDKDKERGQGNSCGIF